MTTGVEVPDAAPQHGFRGDPAEVAPAPYPKALTVAVSREAGARGGAVARKVGELLGWQVYDQEVLDYLLGDDAGRGRLVADLPAAARGWADAHLGRLRRDGRIGPGADADGLVRLLLAIAAGGDAVVVGRGAGHLLPAETTLHVRVVAPFEDRVGYAAQLLRLTREEAAAEVRSRDDRRALFLARAVGRDPSDLSAYDLVVNTSRLGVEGAAQVVAAAVRAKHPFADPGE
jgi:hypothetical protein